MGKKFNKGHLGKTSSKGQRPNVSKKNRAKTDISVSVQMFDANMRRFASYVKGKRAYITVQNTGANRKREPWIRILAKEHFNNTYGTSEEGKKKKDAFLENRYFKMPERPEA